MNESFDPDKYLQEKTGTQLAQYNGFDPDKYLAEKTQVQEQEPTTYSQYVQPWLKPTVETLGTIGGGMAGLLSPLPGGALIGSGLGYAGAKKGYEAVEQALGSGQPQSMGEQLKQIPMDILSGAASEAGGQIASKVLPPVGKKIAEYYNKIPFIQKAAFQASNPTKGQIKELPFKGQSRENIGKRALKEGIVSGNKEKYLEGVSSAKESAGKTIDESLQGLDVHYSNNAKMTKKEAIDALEGVRKSLRSTPRGSVAYSENELSALDDAINTIKERENKIISYRDLNDYITGLSDRVRNFGKENMGSQAVIRSGRTALKNAMDTKLTKIGQQLEELGIPEAKALIEAKKQYAAMATLEDILQGSVAGEQARVLLKPWDYAAGVHSYGLPLIARAVNKYGAANLSNMGNMAERLMSGSLPNTYLRTIPLIQGEYNQ